MWGRKTVWAVGLIGLIIATVGGEVRKYVFNDQGYEELDDILELLA